MEVLSCKTPEMCEKELWVYLLAYNLIRLLMAQAAAQAGVHPRQLSFKHTAQLWTEWVAQGLAGSPAERTTILFHAIAQATPKALPMAEGATEKGSTTGAVVWLSPKPFSLSKCHWD